MLVQATLVPRGQGRSAPELAAAALQVDRCTLGLGISVAVEPKGNGVHEGTVDSAIVGSVSLQEQMKIRGQLGQVHHRAALFAADLLRRALTAK